jgi:hypothetical protein
MKKAAIVIFVCNIVLFCNVVFGDIESGLVAYYNFEFLSGIDGEAIADQSGNGHNGICRKDLYSTKAPTIVPGPDGLGDALSFDGNFYIEIPNHEDFDITQGITMSLWFKVGQFTVDWQAMFCRGDWSWRLARNSSTNSVCFHLSGFDSIYGSWAGSNVNDGQWHNLVGVWEGSGNATKLWIDGLQDVERDDVLTGSINTVGSDPVTIGAQINEGTLQRQWIGEIDDVRLYNRAVADNEIEELYGFINDQSWNSIPSVTLPASKYLVVDSNVAEIKLEGKISDDGFPLPANPSNPDPNDPNKLAWWWEIITKPSEANEPVLESTDQSDLGGSEFVYNNPNQIITVDPIVKLTKPGYYEFRLYASDGEKTNYATTGISLSFAGSLTYEYYQKGYLYLSPVPRAQYESAQTKYLLVRFVEISPYDINNLSSFITVTGQNNHVYTGKTKIASDKKTVILELNSTFLNNELITVSLNPVLDPNSGSIEPYTYQFMTSGAMAFSSQINSDEDEQFSLSSSSEGRTLFAAGSPTIMPNGVSIPSNFPYINITINDNPDSGYIFIDNRTSGSNSYNVIFDNSGNPIWYWQTNDERRDMKVQPNGMLTMLQRSPMSFIGLDKHYRQVKTYTAVNGASTDEHELFVREDGYYYLIGLKFENVDMRQYVSGGSSSASVGQTMIQGFTPENDLIFQWRAWDHFDVRDVEYENNKSSSFRFSHMNAIYFDTDGQILLSSRLLSEVTKINKDTGEIIWRLGGNHSDFKFVNDELNGFRNQHAISATGPRRYLLFDNGDLHSPPVSRAVEYEIDPNKMTATLIWEFREKPDRFSHYMGNTQRLPNGNTLINWAVGSSPKLTEVRPNGTKAFEMNWANGYEAYRTWRCQWDGMALEPWLMIEQKSANTVTLIFNKFGDPNVDYYNIYCGKTSAPTILWAVSDSTLAYISDFTSTGKYYFRVTAVDVNGTESGYSNEKSASITVSGSNVNLVQNGDFSQGINGWTWETSSATASYEIKNGQFHYIIDSPGTAMSSVQLRQNGITLVQGGTYVFEFEAWADSPRTIEAKVGQDGSPWTNYSQIGPTYITTQKKTYSYTFTMSSATDYNSRVVINTGTSDVDVYIDNVSLKSKQ